MVFAADAVGVLVGSPEGACAPAVQVPLDVGRDGKGVLLQVLPQPFSVPAHVYEDVGVVVQKVLPALLLPGKITVWREWEVVREEIGHGVGDRFPHEGVRIVDGGDPDEGIQSTRFDFPCQTGRMDEVAADFVEG